MKNRIKKIKTKIDEIKGYENSLKDKLDKKMNSVKDLNDANGYNNNAIVIFDYMSESKKKDIVNLFEHTISIALKELFDDSYDFKFSFDKRGNSVTCDYLIKNSMCPSWLPIKHCHGESVAEIVSFILRMIYIKIEKSMPFFIGLDEPFEGLNPEKQEKMSRFIVDILKKFNMQSLIISQSEEFSINADNIIELRN
jgi:hypothetical protein